MKKYLITLLLFLGLTISSFGQSRYHRQLEEPWSALEKVYDASGKKLFEIKSVACSWHNCPLSDRTHIHRCLFDVDGNQTLYSLKPHSESPMLLFIVKDESGEDREYSVKGTYVIFYDEDKKTANIMAYTLDIRNAQFIYTLVFDKDITRAYLYPYKEE